MCGLVAVLNTDGRPAERALLKRMSDLIRHRGPDADGYYRDGPVALGHRRLSILDLAGSPQPMSTPDGELTCIFNGEIYNFQDLRSELEQRGHRFATNSDTEAVVHAYEEFGAHCVEHLWGMFALAVWDQQRQILLLARDRLGKKPLVYYQAPDGGLAHALLETPL